MSRRTKYVKALLAFIKQGEKDGKVRPGLSKEIKTRFFWQDPNNENSLRLTKDGHIVLTKTLGLQFYRIALAEGQSWNGSLLVGADRVFDTPYAAETKGRFYNTLILYDEQTFVEMILRGGDLEMFIQSRLS